MSHQTGIKCNQELLDFIGNVKKNDGPNMFSVMIEDEQLKLDSYANGDGDLREDLENHLSQIYTPSQPSYIFIKQNTDPTPTWILIFFSPESCPIRKKMLYASTKSTLKNTFGSGNISMEYFATTLEEMLVKSILVWYAEQMDEDLAPKHQWTTPDADNDTALADHFAHSMPRVNNAGSDFNKRNAEFLTPNEIEKLAVKAQSFQVSLEKNDSKGGKLKIQMSDDCRETLQGFAAGKLPYVKMIFNIEKEQLELSATQSSFPKFDTNDRSQTNQKILIESGNAVKGNTGFHLIRFDHRMENGEQVVNNILVLLVDPNFTKPRERMTYASFCASLVNELSTEFKVRVERRIEADDWNDVTVDYVLEKLYPQRSNEAAAQPEEAPMKFSKPRGPPGRGPRRIIK